MATPSEKRGSSINCKFDVQTLLKDVCFRYIPLAGGVSSLVFSTSVMNPSMFKSLVPVNHHVVANSLWFNSHFGVGLYLYSRKHLKRAPMYYRVLYSVYGAVIFNFGTVLFWATTKALLPKCNFTRTCFGLLSGIAFLAVGKEYMDFVDKHAGNLVTEE